MKIGIRSYTFILLLLLALSSIGVWTFVEYQLFQQQQIQRYAQQQQLWQQQIKSAQDDQLLWLQSRFYDMRAGLQQRLDAQSRQAYIKQYLTNVPELKVARLFATANSSENAQHSDCLVLARSLFSDLDHGAPPLFFSCLQDDQQPMMGVTGNFRIYGEAMNLVIMMDYFGFIPEFEKLLGDNLVSRQDPANHLLVYTQAHHLAQDLEHLISFSRDKQLLGTLQLYFPEVRFIDYWLVNAQWMIPLLLLLYLLTYLALNSAMMRPLLELVGRMHASVTALRPGNNNNDNRLKPGMRLLQRYFMQLTTMAKHDPLTGLHNRIIFEERAQHILLQAKRSARKYALVFIDIDGFHQVNKKYGQYRADGLLRLLAKRLTDGLRESDSLARLQEDNFALLLEYTEDEQLSSLLDKIYQSLLQPYMVYERNIQIGISMGIALYPEHAQELPQLALIADKALQEARQENGGIVILQPNADSEPLSGLSRMQSFRQALENEEFKLVYQPVMNMKNHSTSYFEALLRWKSPAVNQLSIPQTIALAENNKAIRPLTRWIIDSTCRQLAHMNNNKMKIAVNLSMIDLHDEALPEQVDDALKRHHIAPRQLMLEITEGQIMQDQQQVISILNQLSDMGISLSIDDFGTGQASLTYLRKLPVEKLKIDQSFVRDMVSNQDDRTIVEATINLAHTLGVEVVAEGVESIETHDLLEQMGCDYVQGYYISKPMDAEQIPQWCEQA
jgi:diguanylate cyclase (GGDEF)-like protein